MIDLTCTDSLPGHAHDERCTFARMTVFDAAAAKADFGSPSARRRGRNTAYPYVPVLELADGRTVNPTRGRAYGSREDAVARGSSRRMRSGICGIGSGWMIRSR